MVYVLQNLAGNYKTGQLWEPVRGIQLTRDNACTQDRESSLLVLT